MLHMPDRRLACQWCTFHPTPYHPHSPAPPLSRGPAQLSISGPGTGSLMRLARRRAERTPLLGLVALVAESEGRATQEGSWGAS